MIGSRPDLLPKILVSGTQTGILGISHAIIIIEDLTLTTHSHSIPSRNYLHQRKIYLGHVYIFCTLQIIFRPVVYLLPGLIDEKIHRSNATSNHTDHDGRTWHGTRSRSTECSLFYTTNDEWREISASQHSSSSKALRSRHNEERANQAMQ